MILSELREKIKSKYTTVGTWSQLPCPDVGMILAHGGFDWVVADLEHAAFTRSILPDYFRAIESGGAIPIARIADNTRENIKAALDSGAKGLIFPMIETRNMLDDAIAWSLYPSVGGIRGVGFCVANKFGFKFDEYAKEVAEDLLLVAQIEHIHAVDNLDEILSHPRLDAIMVGPYDLSGSMGLMGNLSHKNVQDALSSIHTKAKQYNIPMGLHIVHSNCEELMARIDEGYQFIAYGIDTVFLWENAYSPLRSKKC